MPATFDARNPVQFNPGMSAQIIEVELDHGHVTPRDGVTLPEKARALLTILPERKTNHDPLKPHPELRKIIFHEDPTKPLDPEDWPEAFE